MTAARRVAGFVEGERSLASAKCQYISCDNQRAAQLPGNLSMFGLNSLLIDNNSLRGEKNSLRAGKKFLARGVGITRLERVCAAVSRR
jgi:hypothetical protein